MLTGAVVIGVVRTTRRGALKASTADVRSTLSASSAEARKPEEDVMRNVDAGDEPSRAPERYEVNGRGGRGVGAILDITDMLRGATTIGAVTGPRWSRLTLGRGGVPAEGGRMAGMVVMVGVVV